MKVDLLGRYVAIRLVLQNDVENSAVKMCRGQYWLVFKPIAMCRTS
jgi:hypothetical protein